MSIVRGVRRAFFKFESVRVYMSNRWGWRMVCGKKV
jgi:hypothetical protein